MRMETLDGVVLRSVFSYEDVTQFATNPVRGFPAALTEVVDSVVEAREKSRISQSCQTFQIPTVLFIWLEINFVLIGT